MKTPAAEMIRPELLSPAGSLEAGYYAFQAGADGVYFGLQQFSARAAAKNLSHDDARRLRLYSKTHGKKIYAAVNTLIEDQELETLYKTAGFLDYLEVDGVILQDWGVASFLSEEFPNLVLHGSTQMAIHDWQGVTFAAQQGFKRIVLSREMSQKEIEVCIEETHKKYPAMEFEVFIHGAQCYGFSGLCLASGIQLGRSANRGECSQVCRTWFTDSSTSTSTSTSKTDTHRFILSANDKSLTNHIHQAMNIGIHSFKVEGRMKSPAYVRETIGLYRWLIDEILEGKTLNPEEKEKRELNVKTTFARNWTPGFWNNPRGTDLVNPQYPGATGIELGKVTQIKNNSFRLDTPTELFTRDGLLCRVNGEWITGGVTAVHPVTPGKSPNQGNSSLQWIELKNQGQVQIPDLNSLVSQVSRHDSQLPQIKNTSLPQFSPDTQVNITVVKDGLRVWNDWFDKDYPVLWETSENKEGLEIQLMRIFSHKGMWFSFTPRVSGNPEYLFASPSVLKEVRRLWVQEAEKSFWDRKTPFSPGYSPQPVHSRPNTTPGEIPGRDTLEINGLPFYFPGDPVEPWVELAREKGWSGVWIPLFPISLGFNDWSTLESYLGSSNRQKVILGLGNPGTVYRYNEWKNKYNTISAFLDYGLYNANIKSTGFFHETISQLLSLPEWIEKPSVQQRKQPPTGAVWETGESRGSEIPYPSGDKNLKGISEFPDVSPSVTGSTMDFSRFNPPLFLSRVCSRRMSNQGSCASCPHNKGNSTQVWQSEIQQRGKKFRVISYRCWNLIFQ